MPNERDSGIRNASGGGVAGQHPSIYSSPILVGTSTEDQKNSVVLPLIPVACWAVHDVRFAFDSSFIDVDYVGNEDPPEDIRQELIALKELVEGHKDCPISLFGHADPVGDDVYNKGLSERRAKSVYALLIYKSEPASAVHYWNLISSQENWGKDQQQTMHSFVSPDGGSDEGNLIDAYLKKLSAPGPTLQKTDFLGLGAGADRKASFQGCSEFNPLLIFSQEKQAQFNQAKANNDAGGIADRNRQNAINRRVLGLLFQKGSKVEQSKWPCPLASEGISRCKKQFRGGGPEGERRRSTQLPNNVDRSFETKQDTFGCRFFQRIATACPCLAVTPVPIIIRLFDPTTAPIPKSPYQITVGGNATTTVADDEGFFKVWAASIPEDCMIEWGHDDDDPDKLLFSRKIYLQMDNLAHDEEMKRRLHNLGYAYENALEDNEKAFRLDYSLKDSTDVLSLLRQWYDDTGQIQKRPEAKDL